jgi:hypothetical protein
MMICCDPAVGYKFYVQNNSDKEIQIGYQRSYMDSLVTIGPKAEVMIAGFPVKGSNPHDEGQSFLNNFNQIYYALNDSFTITKNIMDRKNWKYDRDIKYFGIIKTGTNNYYLEINNDDIQ